MIRIDYYKIWEWIYFWIKSRNTTKWHDNYSLVVKRNEQIRAIECMKCADCLHVFSLPILDLEYVKVIDCLMTGCRIEEPNNLVLISGEQARTGENASQILYVVSVYADNMCMCRNTACPFWIWYSFVESGAMKWMLVWACRLYSDWKQLIPALKANAYCSCLHIICASVK